MKATELQIGDYVFVKSKNKTGIVHDITRRDTHIWCGETYGSVYSDRYTYDDIEPIPLTPEILKKNGFVNDASYDECIADYCFVTVQLWRFHGEGILIDWDGRETRIDNDLGIPCESIHLIDAKVHQLQQALRICGLDELANNFQV